MRTFLSQDSFNSHHSVEIMHGDFGSIKNLSAIGILASGAAATGES